MRAPDRLGKYGRAWQAPPEIRECWPTGIGTWLLHCPSAHPLWKWYVVSAASLRDFPGVPTAKLHRPGVTHEVNVFALHPDYVPTSGWFGYGPDRWGAHFLQPLNLTEQFEVPDDELADEMLTLLIRSFCDGHMSPDTDHRRRTERAIQATADHMRRGAPCQGGSAP